MSNVASEGEEHSFLVNVYGCDDECSDIHGKNFQDKQNSFMNTSDVTLKKMLDISAKLVAEQDEISGLETIGWEKHSWKYLSLIGDEIIINLQRAKVYVFSGVVSWKGPSISEVQRILEGQGRMDHN